MRHTFARKSIAGAVRSHVYLAEPGERGGTAIYTLADPRDVRSPRYVGQTREPYARFAQHVIALAIRTHRRLPSSFMVGRTRPTARGATDVMGTPWCLRAAWD